MSFDRKLNIAVCGSFSVGKTTTVNDLYKILDSTFSVSIGKEVAMSLIAKGFLMSKDITEYGIVNYAKQDLYNIRNREGNIYLSDRSLLDLYAYLIVNNSIKIRKSYVDLIYEMLLLESNLFNFYVYIPIETPIEEGNERPIDTEYRTQIDIQIVDVLERIGCDYIAVKGSISERTEAILNKINKFKL